MIIAALFSDVIASQYNGKSSKATSKSGKASIKCGSPYSGKAVKTSSKMVSICSRFS